MGRQIVPPLPVFYLSFPDLVTVTTAAATAAALTAVSATTTAARRAIGLGTGFVHVHRSAVKLGAIQGGDCAVALGIVAHLDESEAAGLSCVTIGHDADAINGAMYFEQGANRIFGSTEAEVSNKNIFQVNFFLQFCRAMIGQDRTRAGGPELSKDAKIDGLRNYISIVARIGLGRNDDLWPLF